MARSSLVPLFWAKVLVIMKILRGGLALSAAAPPHRAVEVLEGTTQRGAHAHVTSRSWGGSFLGRQKQEPEMAGDMPGGMDGDFDALDSPLATFNKQALVIRKKIDQMELQCQLYRIKDKETLASIDRELRIVSGQLANNMAAQSAASNAAEQDQAQAVKLRAQLDTVGHTCKELKSTMDASTAGLADDAKRTKGLKDLAAKCDGEALAALRTSRSLVADASVTPSLLQGCAAEVAAPMLAISRSLALQALNFSTAFAKTAVGDAIRRATEGSSLSENASAWPSRGKPRSKSKEKASNSCKLPKGAVHCGVLKAHLDTIASRIKEQRDAAITEQRKSVDSCVARKSQLNDRLQATQSQMSRSGAEATRLTGVKAGLAATRASIVQRLERAQRDARNSKKECSRGIDEYKGRLDDVLDKRQEVADEEYGEKVAIQDCAVTAWKFSKCSKLCKAKETDEVGHMNATREISKVPGIEGHACPPLSAALPCNDKPCPRNCAVSEWAKWSSCSKACGGGTTKRTRRVVTQAKDGGKGCPSIEERKSCNVGSCSDECKLKKWSSWSPCTRRCKFSKSSAAGRSTRIREVIGHPVKRGGGSPCPPSDHKTRLEVRTCNEEICPAGITCDASQDILLMLDGSAGEGDYFKHQLALADQLVKSSSKKVRFGVLAYGQKVQIISRITGDRDVLGVLSTVATPPGGKRDVTQGEVIGQTLFADPSVGGGRPKIAVLLLGGAPASFVAAKKASEDLRAAGVRVVVGLVDDGSSLARKQACGLASEPCSANVEAVKSWEQVSEEPGRFLAGICRDLVYPKKKKSGIKDLMAALD